MKAFIILLLTAGVAMADIPTGTVTRSISVYTNTGLLVDTNFARVNGIADTGSVGSVAADLAIVSNAAVSAVSSSAVAMATAEAAMITGQTAQATAEAATVTGVTALATALAALPNPYTPASEFTFTTNSGMIAVITYIGSNSTISIPPKINGLQVTVLGDYGSHVTSDDGLLRSVTVPEGVVEIKGYAFHDSTNLTTVILPQSLTAIESSVFRGCKKLSTVTIPQNITYIQGSAFYQCYSLTRINIPQTMVDLYAYAFASCTNLTAVYWDGDAPYTGATVFDGSPLVTNYFHAGAAGFGASLGGRPTALWGPKPIASLTLDGAAIVPDQYGVGALPGVWRTNDVLALDGSTNTLIYLGAP